MDKIIRFRSPQTKTLEDFLEDVIKTPCCKYCEYHDECQEMMGMESIEEELGGYGCSAFDNTVEELTKHYLRDYAVSNTK